MRLETWATVPVAQAARLADECARTLPHLAGSPIRDPRAPQNLTPVSGLEGWLRRLLGNRELLRRYIAVALAERATQVAPLTKRTGSMTERNAAMSGYTGSRATPASPRSSRREEVDHAS